VSRHTDPADKFDFLDEQFAGENWHQHKMILVLQHIYTEISSIKM
jgi:hypothetical protein